MSSINNINYYSVGEIGVIDQLVMNMIYNILLNMINKKKKILNNNNIIYYSIL